MVKSHLLHFWRKIHKTDTHWYWTGANNGNGYGVFGSRSNGVKYFAHRLTYETIRGRIPEGYDLRNLCGIRSCVRPDHWRLMVR